MDNPPPAAPGEPRPDDAAAPSGHVSLEEIHRTVAVPPRAADFGSTGARWSARRCWSASVTWTRQLGHGLAGGAQFKYGLLWVVALASVMAIFLQVISARLGVATGKDLAQCCRDWYPPWLRWPNWLLCELAIGACDLAEVLGSAVALNLMFHIPLFWAVIITGFDVLLCWPCNGSACGPSRPSFWCSSRPSPFVITSKFLSSPRRSPSFLEMGRALLSPRFASGRDGLCRHRHHRRDGDAAQFVSAFRARAEPEVAGRRALDPPRDQVQHH